MNELLKALYDSFYEKGHPVSVALAFSSTPCIINPKVLR